MKPIFITSVVLIVFYLVTESLGQSVSPDSTAPPSTLGVEPATSTNAAGEQTPLNVVTSAATNPPETKSTAAAAPETTPSPPPPVTQKVVTKAKPAAAQNPKQPQLWGGIFSGKEGSVLGTVLGFVPPFIRNQAVDLLNSIALNAPGAKVQGQSEGDTAEQSKVAKEDEDEEQEENEGGDE